jgi:TIR domain
MQQKRPTIVPFILSFFLAVFILVVIEYVDSTFGIKKLFLGSSLNMKQFQEAVGGNFYKTTMTCIVMILIVLVIYAIVYLIVFECVALLYFFITSRWVNQAVFISYKNTEDDSKADTTKMAVDIKKVLEKNGFRVYFFKYTKTMRHDFINKEIQTMLRRSHSMVVIPDPYRPSYVDTEIQYAAIEEKPVFLIRHTKDQKLPNTANTGHVVLSLDELKKEEYQQLVYLLRYVNKNWHSRLFIPGMPLDYFFKTIGNIIDSVKSYGLAFAGFFLSVFLLIYFSVPVNIVLIMLKIIVTVIGIIAAYITLDKIIQNIDLQKLTRQSFISSGKTYKHYQEAKFPQNILDCFDKVGLSLQEEKTS